MKIYVAGNCQAQVMADLLGAATGLPAETIARDQPLESDRLVFAQSDFRRWVPDDTILFPRISTPGFHPDIVNGREYYETPSPLRSYSSSIVLKAWCEGLPAHAAVALFNADVFEQLGFFDYFEAGKEQLLKEGRQVDFPLEDYLERWFADGCFMHTCNHPKVRVMVDIAHALLAKTNLDWKPLENPVDIRLNGCGWPVYPEIAARLGLEGNYEFRMNSRDGGRILDLKEFVEQCFEMYTEEKLPRKASTERLTSPRYENIRSHLPPQIRGRHPYVGLPDHQYWRQSVRGDVDPVTKSFTITPHMKVATAGSCFAQHISTQLAANGFNYFVAETDPGTGGSNYGVFSARYGNIYTARQLLQLFNRAYGRLSPRTRIWQRGQRFVDPFRPEIEPNGFDSAAAVYEARTAHFEAVRRMFEELDVFVFTLGLTEAWCSKANGSVFPLAPGVAGGVFNPEQYEFVNFGVSDVVSDLKMFLGRLSKINPRARVILTVSPVPLIATYEPRHVLVSTTYSKSVLRVAAEEVARSEKNVVYFPSYEIITGGFNRGRYFAPDLRTVTPNGVEHVMRMFFRHFSPDAAITASVKQNMEVVCEEEALVRPVLRPAQAARIAAARAAAATGAAPARARRAPVAAVAPPPPAPVHTAGARRSLAARLSSALKRLSARISARITSLPNARTTSDLASRPK